ncbi:MAG: glycosyltransferase [Desulfarculaceae bacterium]|nr:glycosyltransferase [Desulfarculaceae bacterium]
MTSAIKILHLSTSDREGGAAIAAYRLHQKLLGMGHESSMGLLYRTIDDQTTSTLGGKLPLFIHPLKIKLDAFPLRLYRRRLGQSLFSPMWIPSSKHKSAAAMRPDITHLHWVGHTFLPVYALRRLAGPMVWTLHDAWPFTGGCHLTGDCQNYLTGCGHCEQLNSRSNWDLSRYCFRRKQKFLDSKDIVFVSPSEKHRQKAERSRLMQGKRIEVIEHGVDTSMFRPLDKGFARDLLGLPQESRVLLFGAFSATTDKNKGYDVLRAALARLPQVQVPTICLVFGAPNGDTEDVSFPVRFLGRLHEDMSMAVAYSASDVFISASREESFSLTALEATACGTPVVSFPTGAIPQMVAHRESGYIAEPNNARDLAEGIAWVSEDPERHRRLSAAARQRAVERFDQEAATAKYVELYRELLQAKRV